MQKFPSRNVINAGRLYVQKLMKTTTKTELGWFVMEHQCSVRFIQSEKVGWQLIPKQVFRMRQVQHQATCKKMQSEFNYLVEKVQLGSGFIFYVHFIRLCVFTD